MPKNVYLSLAVLSAGLWWMSLEVFLECLALNLKTIMLFDFTLRPKDGAMALKYVVWDHHTILE